MRLASRFTDCVGHLRRRQLPRLVAGFVIALAFLTLSSAAQAAVTVSSVSTAKYPIGLDFDSSGNLFIVSQDNPSGNLGLVVVPEASGTLFGQTVSAGQENLLVATASIRGVAVDRNDDVFYSLSDGKIYALTSSSRTVFGVSVTAHVPTLISTSGSLAGPLEFDSSGNLWGVYPSASSIGVLPASTGTLFNQSVTANVVSTFSMASGAWIWDIAFDSAGNLLYSDGWGNQGVWVFPKNSGTFFAQALTAFAATEITGFSSVFGRAAGIDSDTAGNVFVVLYGSSIYVYSPAGGEFVGQTVPASTVTQLAETSGKAMQGVAVTDDGKLVSGGYTATFLFDTPSSSSSSSSSSNAASSSGYAGAPGIYLSVNSLLMGKPVAGAPVYYGADRVAATSTYVLRVSGVSNGASSVVILAEGTIDADGSFSSMVRLPELAPGTYNIRMTGRHTNGSTLELTSQVRVEAGVLSSVGENVAVIR